MRKRIMSFLKWISCVVIAISLLSGCSPKEGTTNSDKSTGKAEREKVTNVFKTNWLLLPEGYTGSSSFVFNNDRIYMLVSQSQEYTERSVIISYDSDGGDMQTEKAPYDDITNFTILSDGSRVFLLLVYNSATLTNEYWLNKIDTSGNEVFSVNVSAMIQKFLGGGSYYAEGAITNIAIDSEDRIYLRETMSVVVVSSSTGERLFYHNASSVINGIVQVGGKVAIQYSEGNAELKYIDVDKRKIGDNVYTPTNFDIQSYQVYSSYGDNDSEILYYYKTATGLYSVSESDEKSTEVINWMNSDISPSMFADVTVINNDRVFYTDIDTVSYDMTRAVLMRIPDDEVVPKYIIEIAYVNSWSNDTLLYLVAKFNQESEDYRVKLTDYKQLSGNLENDELTSFINSQFAIGNIPDVFLISSPLTGKEYEDKGLFCDLYEYLDNDSELGRDDFLKCVLPAGEVDGKLYYLINSFSVNTVVGKTENIGNLKGWSMSDFLDIAENLDDGVKMLLRDNRNYVYDYLVKEGLSEFIDYESGTCSFNSDLFIRLLNYLRSLPSNSDIFYSGETAQRELRENMALVDNARIYDFIEYARQKVLFGTEELAFVGYPGYGEKISISSSYAISAKSEKEIRDGAWAFIKYSFSNPVGSSSEDRFPSTYEAFYQFGENEMNHYYLVGPGYSTTESSVEFTQEQINVSGGSPLQITQEDVDEVLSYLESIEPVPMIDSKVYEIIDEEMQYFFADAKTAEETANLIQSRVSIYLSESK